jgi:hypothetical protein
MPVDRPWGELLVHAGGELLPYVAVAANIDSLHRMTREERDLRGLILYGSDHLTAYNIFAEAVNRHGAIGQVYGLPRHLFGEDIEDLVEQRGVLLKALEDIALGTASVYRTLEQPLPATFPMAEQHALRSFQDLLARIMPFDLVLDERLANGDAVRMSRGSFCGPGAIAGTVRYFADRFGVPRAAIEGTNIPPGLVKRYARRSAPSVTFRPARHREGLYVERVTNYFGFELDEEREPLTGVFPEDLAEASRGALARALLSGEIPHPDRGRVARAAVRLDEYWRRSGGTLAAAAPERVLGLVTEQLSGVNRWEDFARTRVSLESEVLIPDETRHRLDALPDSLALLGDRMPIVYEMEKGMPVARIRLKEGQARRIRDRDLPKLDRPIRFAIARKGGHEVRAASLDELRALADRTSRERHRRHKRRR